MSNGLLCSIIECVSPIVDVVRSEVNGVIEVITGKGSTDKPTETTEDTTEE